MTSEQLRQILDQHGAWLKGDPSGQKANLFGADLRRANLYRANLREANLCESDLREANLYGTNLYRADLYRADLRETDLRGANLREANLCEANLREANLIRADLYGTKVDKFVLIKEGEWTRLNGAYLVYDKEINWSLYDGTLKDMLRLYL